MGDAFSKDGIVTNIVEAIPGGGILTAPVHAIAGNGERAGEALIASVAAGAGVVVGGPIGGAVASGTVRTHQKKITR